MKEPLRQSYANPALQQYEHDVSLTRAGASFSINRMKEALNMQLGRGETAGQAEANTYIRHKSSTLWGHAYYKTGKKTDVVWNECSDLDLIYPYVTADSIGGDLTIEKYSLAGGYAGQHNDWNWGCKLSYDAGLEYRKRDPRPRNITGLLGLKVGTAYTIRNRHNVGISLSLEKYKQTNDMMFVSETGKIPTFHLTGLGTHYDRFAGSSETCHYKGERYGISFDLLPKRDKGIFTTINLSRFQFTKQLTDLNRLPLLRAWHNEMRFSGGWIAERWSVSAEIEASRRHGTENLFGDAMANVYPLIGSLTMYAENRFSATLNGILRVYRKKASLIAVKADAKFRHCQELYADPVSYETTDGLDLKTGCVYKVIFSQVWDLESNVWGNISLPFSDSMQIHTEQRFPGLTEMETAGFRNRKSRHGGFRIEGTLTSAIKNRFGLGMNVSWDYERYAIGISENAISASIIFSF